MCCILNIIGKIVSHLLYFSEKFVYCFTCSALVSCLVATILVTLGMGIGIGYNYCFVDFKTRHRYVPAKHYRYHPDNRYYPGYRPGYHPGYHPGNRYPPGYHPDNRYPPGYHPGYHPGYQPGYHPGYHPGDHPDNRYPPGYHPDYKNYPDYKSYHNPHWKRSTPTHVTESGVTDIVNDIQAADSSKLTRNENETQSQNNTNNTKQSYNNINNETIKNMHENKDQVIQTNKQTSSEKPPDDSPNLIVPISGLDLIALLSKFRSENRNFSLPIVTT